MVITCLHIILGVITLNLHGIRPLSLLQHTITLFKLSITLTVHRYHLFTHYCVSWYERKVFFSLFNILVYFVVALRPYLMSFLLVSFNVGCHSLLEIYDAKCAGSVQKTIFFNTVLLDAHHLGHVWNMASL